MKVLQHHEGLFEISDVMLSSPTFEEHIIHVHLCILSDLLFEELVDKSLISCSHIFYAKWYDPIIEKTFVSNKNYFFFIFRSHAIWLQPEKASIKEKN